MPFTLEKKVDLEGFEPSSKRGNNMLSTCLFPLWFSNLGKTGTTNQDLSLQKFHRRHEAALDYSRFICTTGSRRLGTTALG